MAKCRSFIFLPLMRYSSPLPVTPSEDRIATIGVEDSSISTIVQSTPSKNILVQRWGGGTACSLNNQPRSVEVHYLCLPGQQARIVSVKEPRSCHYLVEISTPQLCQKSLFAEKNKPIVYPIHCSEIVPDDLVEIKTKEAAAKKAAFRSNLFGELGSFQTSEPAKLPQIKYLARFSKGGNQPNVIALLDEQLKTTKGQSSPLEANTQVDSGGENGERAPEVPSDDFYGTISKLLDLIKHEVTPVKPEREDDEETEDEL
ncbi:Protein OS-9 [Massospora cicadina]|nr:Protein OS-9 [Massospora cicadina]